MFRFYSLILTLLFVGVLFLSGCSIAQRQELTLAASPSELSDARVSRPFLGIRMTVRQFDDRRSVKSVGNGEGLDYTADGDPGLAVQRGFEERLKSRGADVVLFDSKRKVDGEVLDWGFKYARDGMTFHVEATAKIRVFVRDEKGAILAGGVYTGGSTVERPLVTSQFLEDVLSQAMGQAIDQAIEDDSIVRAATLS